jgi:hypothetical protein
MPDGFESHYRTVVRAISEGRVIPLLGAGVNLCGRPKGLEWRRGQYLPSAAELAAYLAGYFEYPTADLQDLIRVSQYASVMTGLGPLYEELHQVLDADYPSTSLHRFLAALPGILRAQGTPRYQLILTTNYDDALERAFREAGEPYDLVWYIAEGEHRGKFYHLPPDGRGRIIDKPNKYLGFALDKRTVIAKIHGAVDRLQPERDSFVITEDHYIDYLTRTEVANLVPVQLAAKLRRSHFLFLGYSMRDWNLRVILHRIWGQQALDYKSWAIQVDPEPIDREFWSKRGVDILKIRLEDYVDALAERLQQQSSAAGVAQ